MVVLSAGIFAACGDDDNNDKNADDSSTTTTATAGATTITLVATNFKFDQTAITAKAGEATTFTIKNDGTVEHNLSIEKLDVDKDAEAGESASQTVTPAAGTYEYHCEYHPTQMTGTLTVS